MKDLMDNERDDLAEAQAILAGGTLLLPTVAHLRAIKDHYQEQREVSLIRVANMLEQMKTTVLNME